MDALRRHRSCFRLDGTHGLVAEKSKTFTDVSQFAACSRTYAAQDSAEIWNIHISDRIPNPSTRRQRGRGHGKM